MVAEVPRCFISTILKQHIPTQCTHVTPWKTKSINLRPKSSRSKEMEMRMEIPALFSTLQHLMDIPEETEKSLNAPTRTYVRDARAMAATAADVKELPNAYVFAVDMPGVKSGEIKVQVEDGSILVISGERKRENEKEGEKYLRMERRMGELMRKFSLPENANTDAVSAVCQDGVLTVTVEKHPPPQPKKPRSIEVKVA